MEIIESFKAYGHELISALHKTTLEITKDDYLTRRGDCIIALKSEKACSDLSDELKNSLRREGSIVRLILESKGIVEEVKAMGSRRLILNDPRSIVLRKSDYVDSRTLAIRADKAARDLKRDFVETIKDKRSVIQIIIEVKF